MKIGDNRAERLAFFTLKKVNKAVHQDGMIQDGDRGNYLVRGEYHLTGTETIELRLAVPGASTGYQAFLFSGSGKFVLYAHVLEPQPDAPKNHLDILMPDDKARIGIHLEGWTRPPHPSHRRF